MQVCAGLFGALALVVCMRPQHGMRERALATALMALGVVSLHFTAMVAVAVEAGPLSVDNDALIPTALMVPLITAVAFSLLFTGLAAAIFARDRMIPGSARSRATSASPKAATFSGSKPAKALRMVSRLRRMVIQASPA